MEVYKRYLQAELRAWNAGLPQKAMLLARWKARAYRMYAVDSLYF